jgi:coenzyme F420-reducing hydrogenase beta subunit
MINLVKDKKTCCGCAACYNICPKNGIEMKPDEDGFLFPMVNIDLCVECGLCKKVCDFQKDINVGHEALATYAAINNSRAILSHSSSGGVFGALASFTFEHHGVVFGCAWNEKIEAEHICIKSGSNLKKLQGSKYVQSNINRSYREVEAYLKKDVQVLFAGTPCQVAGLKSYLGQEYNNLLTAELICHGVPNQKFFNDYISYLEATLKGRIIDFNFRDKTKGWSLRSKAIYQKNKKIYSKTISNSLAYYYEYFSKGYICRESCYVCKYAGPKRQGDFTLGDYWGIEQAHPEIKTKNGVSALLVNTEKGISLLDELKKHLILVPSTFEQVSKKNRQLCAPVPKNEKRDKILRLWHHEGAKGIADSFKVSPKEQVMSMARAMLPYSIKEFIRKYLYR